MRRRGPLALALGFLNRFLLLDLGLGLLSLSGIVLRVILILLLRGPAFGNIAIGDRRRILAVVFRWDRIADHLDIRLEQRRLIDEIRVRDFESCQLSRVPSDLEIIVGIELS